MESIVYSYIKKKLHIFMCHHNLPKNNHDPLEEYILGFLLFLRLECKFSINNNNTKV